MRALNVLRTGLHYRREAFSAGLRAAGYRVTESLTDPKPGDCIVAWNRYGHHAEWCRRFEQAGAAVWIAENSPLPVPNAYSIARHHVAMSGGVIPAGGPERWQSFGIPLAPWRNTNGVPLILAQRQIGHPSVASPLQWAETTQRKLGGRIRQHPGQGPATPLADDLASASCVVTWSSAAAIQALLHGVPVWHEHRAFIGAAASKHVDDWGQEPRRDDAARVAVMQRLAWGVWSLSEIESGAPFLCKS